MIYETNLIFSLSFVYRCDRAASKHRYNHYNPDNFYKVSKRLFKLVDIHNYSLCAFVPVLPDKTGKSSL